VWPRRLEVDYSRSPSAQSLALETHCVATDGLQGAAGAFFRQQASPAEHSVPLVQQVTPSPSPSSSAQATFAPASIRHATATRTPLRIHFTMMNSFVDD